MREIKFRVWDKRDKHMHYMPAAELYEELFLRADGVLCNVDEGANIKKKISDPRPAGDRYEVSFSTGLLDCDGKEIWEGDVLDCICVGDDSPCAHYTWRTPVPVYFSTENNAYVAVDKRGWIVSLNSPVHYKVIGNKFGNPELLEGKE